MYYLNRRFPVHETSAPLFTFHLRLFPSTPFPEASWPLGNCHILMSKRHANTLLFWNSALAIRFSILAPNFKGICQLAK